MSPKYFAHTSAAFALGLAALVTTAVAADGEILITQSNALTGNVTPRDAPGFPVTLTAPGSYKLAGNLQAPPGKNGINIAAENVTIDLNGFQLAGGTLASRGIEASGGRAGVTIRNGTITGFRGDGILGTGSYWTVENMRVAFNGGNGISAGHMLQVRDSIFWINKQNGVLALNWTIVRDSTIVGSGGNGVSCASYCLIEGNVISANGRPNGGGGVAAGLGTVLGNTIGDNVGFGISGSHTGYGNNTLIGNNYSGGGVQVSNGLFPLEPNHCFTKCQAEF